MNFADNFADNLGTTWWTFWRTISRTSSGTILGSISWTILGTILGTILTNIISNYRHCEKTASSFLKIKTHIKDSHTPGYCEDCNKTFKNNDSYRRHRKTGITVKLGFKERLKSEQIGISEQFCDDQEAKCSKSLSKIQSYNTLMAVMTPDSLKWPETPQSKQS